MKTGHLIGHLLCLVNAYCLLRDQNELSITSAYMIRLSVITFPVHSPPWKWL